MNVAFMESENQNIKMIINENDGRWSSVSIEIENRDDWGFTPETTQQNYNRLSGLMQSVNRNSDFSFPLCLIGNGESSTPVTKTHFTAHVSNISKNEAKVTIGIQGPLPHPSPRILGKEYSVKLRK